MRPSWLVGLGALLGVALVVRLASISLLGDAMNGDEAVGALMALTIARGEQFPLVFWEAHYSGTLPFVLGAAAFRLVEPSVTALRIAILPLGLVGIAAVVSAARALWGAKPALVGGLWLALGPPLLFAYSTQAMNGYPEVLAFGGLTLWLATQLRGRPRTDAGGSWRWTAFGAVAGFGVYSLLFVLPLFVGALWALRRVRGAPSRRELASVAAGFVVGVSPFVIHNVIHPGASVIRLGARVFDVSRDEVARSSNLIVLAGDKVGGYLLRLVESPATLMANIPPALGLPVWGAWVAIAVVVVAAVAARGRARGDFGVDLLARCGLLTLLFVWVAELGAPRHLFPFYLLVPLGIAALWAHASGWCRLVGGVGLVLILTNNVVATARDPSAGKPTVRELVAGLDARGVRFVYTDYAIAYPLVFLSRERIVASPAAGPTNVDRYPRYTRVVAASPSPAYVFLHGSEAGAVFARQMRRAGRPFSQEAIGTFDLYLPERHVDPGELALLRKF